MAFDVNWDSLKGNLFDLAKENVKDFIDDSSAQAGDFYKDLREFTDRVTDAKKELAEAEGIKKDIKMQTLDHEIRNLDSMITRHKLIVMNNNEERVKEILITVAKTAGKIAMSMLLA